jgi:formiminoglutamate deiminase
VSSATAELGRGEAPPKQLYWCEQAWLGEETAAEGVLLGVSDGRIASLDRADAPPAGAVRLDGLTLPGMANAHSHAFQRALRGRTHTGTGTFWTWREQMYALAEVLDPDSYRALARATFAEMALAGMTLVGEFHYVHHGRGGVPYEDPNELGNVIVEAAAAAGIRLTLLDTCYLHGGIDVALSPTQQRFADRDAEAWCARVDELWASPRARMGAAIHSVRAVDPDSAGVVAEWASSREAPLHAHVSEQALENEQCLAAYGATPTALLAARGALKSQFTAVHATHLTAGDVALLGEGGASCCFCPTTERDLADGTGDARALRDAGARIALGSDSHAVIDPFEEARAMELDERLASGERGRHSAVALLEAATTDGYTCLGWPDGGQLAVGMLADFTTVGLGSVRLAGTDPEHAPAAAVFAAGAEDVRNVVVGGREIVRDGAHVDIDVAGELRTAIAAVTP